MSKKHMEKARKQIAKLPIEELVQYFSAGLMLIQMMPPKQVFQTMRELVLMKQTMEEKGIIVKKIKEGQSTRIRFEDAPKVDEKVNSPITMAIPSVSALINGPIQPDLPKHGYISKSGPTIYL